MNSKSLDQLFWNSTTVEMSRGWVYDLHASRYLCLLCGEEKIRGKVYPHGEDLYDARTSMEKHINEAHGSVFQHLLNLNKQSNGLTETQKRLMNDLYQGLSDKEIAKKKGGSPSTIRNQRFTLREKEKQSKVFIALMHLLQEHSDSTASEKLVDIHAHATMVDDRYVMTEEEYEKVIHDYFPQGTMGPLKDFPVKKEKRKIAILRNLMQHFTTNRNYTEKEINGVLKPLYHDYVLLRRYLIQYGFMDRKKDGSAYWVK